jgi:hypothetical protein
MMAGIIDDSNPWFTAEEYPADPDYAAKEAAAELKAAADPNWPKIDATAYYGLAGEIVSVMAPQTEADQVALLMQFLVYAGNAIGRGPYYLVNKDRHYANLYLLIAGISSRARKGLSAGLIRVLMELADPGWTRNCLTGGLSSGEGVLHAIRDPVYGMRGGEWTLIDPGVADKRLMLDEREFYSALTVMRREGNIVSRIIRDAWELPASPADADQDVAEPGDARVHQHRRPHHDQGVAADARLDVDGQRLRQPVSLCLRPPLEAPGARRQMGRARHAGGEAAGEGDRGASDRRDDDDDDGARPVDGGLSGAGGGEGRPSGGDYGAGRRTGGAAGADLRPARRQ